MRASRCATFCICAGIDMPWPELLQSAPKAPGSFDRSVPVAHTLALIPQLRERFGITRIADITHLDRIGIPVMSAIVPNSADVISIYNGKGTTREGALAGAVMEAVERQVATAPCLPVLMRDAKAVLGAIDRGGRKPLVHQRELPVVAGRDLLTGDAIDVPLALVQCPWPGESVVFGDSSNGLAAGNTFDEAVYHAVCELLERHLWAVAHAIGYLRPRAILSRFAGGGTSIPVLIDDPVVSEIELLTGFAAVDALVGRIRQAGFALSVRAFERDPFPILFLATIADPAGGESSAHTGHGCSWSPEHAAIRALTEAAQSRAADFLAAREDLRHYDDPAVSPYAQRRTFGVPYGRWHYDAPAPMRTLGSFTDRSTNDVAADVNQIVTALRQVDAGPVAIVDLTPDGLPVHVVRAVAPRLESVASGGRYGPSVRAILDLHSTLTT
jgi:ribosomal protein S12 methylthiotransferase accessory factor